MPHEPPKKETKPRGSPPSFAALGALTPAETTRALAEVERLSRALELAEKRAEELEADRALLVRKAAGAEARVVGGQRTLARVLCRVEDVLKTQLRGVVTGAERYRMWDYVKEGPPSFWVRNNRDAKYLDATFRALPAVDAFLARTVEGKFVDEDGCYQVVVHSGDPGYVKYACTNQGYAEVVEDEGMKHGT